MQTFPIQRKTRKSGEEMEGAQPRKPQPRKHREPERGKECAAHNVRRGDNKTGRGRRAQKADVVAVGTMNAETST